MKILLFGETGMLGQAIKQSGLASKYDIVGSSRTGVNPFDLMDYDSISVLVSEIKPDIIINAAALVNIDKCESDPTKAYLLNARSVCGIVNAASKYNSYFIQISTDHYFTGEGKKKHTEEDRIKLINEYARTKYVGEIFALTYPKSLVIRTNIVGFRKRGESTFVEWIIKSLKSKSVITCFEDYFISSIDVRQLAFSIFKLISIKPTGILNIASSEVFSKKDFIYALAKEFNIPLSFVKNGSVFQSGLVKRAESNGLDVSKAERILGHTLPTLKEVVGSLKEEYHRYL